MADIQLTIKSTLETATGKKAFPLQKPIESVDDCTVYQVIAQNSFLYHGGVTDVKKARVQITSISSSYSGLQTVKNAVDSAFIGTTTGWLLSIPLETNVELFRDDLYMCIREFYIFYK